MIDLRSDTVSRPSEPMLHAMADAAVGDDVLGDDPTVAALEAKLFDLLGKEAAVFVPSGTQSNLCALLAHCQRGDEYLAGENAHMYRFEAGGGAVLGSIQPQPVRVHDDGRLDLDHASSVIKPADHHFADTRLLCLENTHDGMVVPLDHQRDAADLAQSRGLSTHLDGARLWNATVALGVPPAVVAEPFDSVSVCLSKGLGAPIGSVLVGSSALIDRARKWRKMLGGGMRQSGVLAAAGLYAIEHNLERLSQDHANAAHLAAGLANLPGVAVVRQATNMVFAHFDVDCDGIAEAAKGNDVSLLINDRRCRMVTHLDVSTEDVTTVVEVLADCVGGRA